LKPREVLKLHFWEVNAVLTGYQKRLTDLRCIAVENGYYAAYYTNNKNAKSVGTVVKELQKTEEVKKRSNAPNVDAFLAMEQTFKDNADLVREATPEEVEKLANI
jgi:ABC-type Na+ efflux pump permease subunit